MASLSPLSGLGAMIDAFPSITDPVACFHWFIHHPNTPLFLLIFGTIFFKFLYGAGYIFPLAKELRRNAPTSTRDAAMAEAARRAAEQAAETGTSADAVVEDAESRSRKRGPGPLGVGLVGDSTLFFSAITAAVEFRPDVCVVSNFQPPSERIFDRFNESVNQSPAMRASRQCHSLDEIMADRKVDIVFVGASPSERFGIILQALRRRKHVLSKAPMAPTAALVEKLCAAARSNNCVLMEAHPNRLHPAMARVKVRVRGLYIDKSIGDRNATYGGFKSRGVRGSAGATARSEIRVRQGGRRAHLP